MQEEQNAQQDEEVEAHSHARPAPSEEPNRLAREDEDEVEAHSHARPSHIAEPEARRE